MSSVKSVTGISETKTDIMALQIKHNAPSQPALSYYDQARQKFMAAPFGSRREETDFAVPLRKWGDVCEETRNFRRQFYRVDGVVTSDQLAERALSRCKIVSSDKKRTIDVFFYRIPVNRFEVDAVINAANEALLGGGGVDKEIHDGAGPNLVRECAHIRGGCEVGQAKITKGYDLPAKYVLHTVGPLLKEDETGDEAALRSCYVSCLKLCNKIGLKSLVAPCVACGFYAFPLEQSAKVVKKTLQDYVDSEASTVRTVVLSVPRDVEWEAYTTVFGTPADCKEQV